MRRYALLLLSIPFLVFAVGLDLNAQVNQDSPWPMFRHDVKHTGRSPYTGPGQPTLYWTYQANDGVASSPSIGPDGTVYVGSGWYWQKQTDSALYALNPDGTLKWKYLAAGGIFSSPAIGQDGTIYFGSFDRYLHAIEDSVTYAKLKWKTYSGHWIMNSPLIADDGTVFFGALNFKFFAVDPFGNIKWDDQVGWCVFSSPALADDGRIVVGSKDHTLYVYNDLGDNFSYDWTYPIGTFYDGHLIDCSPAIGPDGTIYFGADQFGAAGHSGEDVVQIDTAFYAVNPDGTLKWFYQVGNGVESSPAIGENNTVYFGSFDSTFYALKDNGNNPILLWKYKTGGAVDASPTIGGDGTIYIGSRDSTLYAFNPDGTIQWTFDADGGIESSVAINGDGVIYFGGMDGKIYALGSASPDVGPVDVGIPAFIDANTIIDPAVTVRNYRVSESGFDITLIIDDGVTTVYSDAVSIPALAGGDSVEVNMASWAVGPDTDIYYNVTAITTLNDDINYVNDTLTSIASTGAPFVCGDVNGSGSVNILDITYMIAHLYKGGPAPDPVESGDVNQSGSVNILDITYLIGFLYKGGLEPECF